MAAQDWLSKFDAMDIGRRDHPELSDHDLWQMLEDAAGPLPEIETLPDGTRKIVKVYEPLSGGNWPVRRILQPAPGAHFSRWAYFGPDVQRLFSSIGKSKPASKSTKRFSANETRELRDFLVTEARNTPDGFLTYRAGEKLVKDRYGDKFPRNTVRRVMREAGIVTSKPGTRSKTPKPRLLS